MWAIVCDFIKLDPKNEESVDMGNMDIKNIDKLRELKGFEWGNRNRIKENHGSSMNSLVFERLTKTVNGESKWIDMFNVSANNLDELEFYGLKVVLDEKPKLTREEKILIECHEDEFFIARSENNSLCIFEKMPQQCSLGHWGRIWGDDRLVINSELFPFITWESGKAWSKSELMELEVVE